MTVLLLAASLTLGSAAFAAPATVNTTVKQQAAAHAAAVIPPEVAARLRKAGLDPGDPNLASKLKSLAKETTMSYTRTHVLNSAPLRIAKSPGASFVGQSVVGHLGNVMGVTASIVGLLDFSGRPVTSNPTIGLGGALGGAPDVFNFLVRTSRAVFPAYVSYPGTGKGGMLTPASAAGTVSFATSCSVPSLDAVVFEADVGEPQPGRNSGTMPPLPTQPVPDATGGYLYYASTYPTYWPVGKPRTAGVTVQFAGVSAGPLNVTLVPDEINVLIDATIDHTPAVAGVGTLAPWGPTGLDTGNASLGSPGTPRVGTGDFQVQVQGNDLVSLPLGPGWKVLSATIKSAVSATAPQEIEPDNQWRGAAVTIQPLPNDSRTTIHWHYSGIDSLDYTIEWRLAGPNGQRPLMTMAKSGSCDS